MAGNLDLTIEPGATFRSTFTWKDKATGEVIDLTGYSARMQVRKNAASDPVLELTTDVDGGIILSDEDGWVITLLVPASDTAELPKGAYRYDLLMEDGDGFVTRLLEGAVTIKDRITA